jgi:hypothetical protein
MRLGPLAAFNASISTFVVHYRADIEYSPLDHCVGIATSLDVPQRYWSDYLMYHRVQGRVPPMPNFSAIVSPDHSLSFRMGKVRYLAYDNTLAEIRSPSYNGR